MVYIAPWSPPSYTAPWPAPPAATLSLVHLIGDLQMEDSAAPDGASNFDAVGRDISDRLINLPPQAAVQVGDAIQFNPSTGISKWNHEFFDLYSDWLSTYSIEPVKVMGNHEIGNDVVTPEQWADKAGVPGRCYTVDLGQMRLTVLGGDTYQPAFDVRPYPILPLFDQDVSWLDARLSEDSRPTLVAAHAPIAGMETANPNANARYVTQETLSAGRSAGDLLAVLDSHPHVMGWLHGHTHDPYRKSQPNVSTFTVGSRRICVVDAGVIVRRQRPNLPVTPYVSVLDDGLTVEVRWRHHDAVLWDTVPGHPRVLTATAT